MSTCTRVIRRAADLILLKHGAVLGDSVSVLLWHFWIDARLVLGSGRPGEVIPSDLNVVVGEFAKLVVVHSEEFGFLGGSEVKTRDVVDSVSENCGDDESVGCACDNVCQLDIELAVVVVEPATSESAGCCVLETSVDTIKTNDVVCTEESVEHKSDHTGDTVLSEHIHRVVDSNPVLDLGGKVSNYAGSDA